MNKVNNISTARLINSNCLIEIADVFNRKTESGIIVGHVDYHKAVHAIRFGVLTRMPDQFNWEKASWVTDSFPDEGDDVIFDYLDAHEAPLIESKGKTYLVLPYFSLLVARSPSGGTKLLNGYLLAQKQPIPMSKLEVKQRYYDDIYKIVYSGKSNLSYKESKQVDDTSITANDIIMTRSSAYPVLEESLHAKFSDETYYYFKRTDVIAKVEEL